MSEIKINVWDKRLKRMWRWKTDICALRPDGSVDLLNADYVGASDAIKLPYIGTKDKNGVEIHEGDIVDSVDTGTNYYPNRQVVEHHSMAFMYVGKTKDASPHCEFTLSTITNKHIVQDNAVEVIGNIYENPDLLDIRDENDNKSRG